MTGDKLGFRPKDDHRLFKCLFNRASLLKRVKPTARRTNYAEQIENRLTIL